MTILHGIVSKNNGLSARNISMERRLELVKTVLEFTRWDDIAARVNDARTLVEYLSSAKDSRGATVLEYANLMLKDECENDQERAIAKQIAELLTPKKK